MAIGRLSPNTRSYGLLILVLSTVITMSSALEYASNLTVSSKTANTATLTWTSATSGGNASSYIVSVVLDTSVLENVTISTVATNTHTITGLTYSTFYTVLVYTYDSTGQSTGEAASVSFWTKYTTWNTKFIGALGVIGFIIVTLLTMIILKSKCLPADPKPMVMDVEKLVEDGAGVNDEQPPSEQGNKDDKEKPKSPIKDRDIAIF
ncbi:uncharacterized protein [Asterias amurensis]|uniref:uncharacterized protein n=1 Tax=Asterias amurensis TaxID=7602 RepID=UPI003AB492C0